MSTTVTDDFYRAFEDRYRGSRETITGRLKAYLPFVEPLAALYQPARAFDAGCGRGEWLELIGSAGFAAAGVDLDDGMLAECRARGLDVRTADALVALREMPENSLALVSAFHLVEHIGFDQVRALVRDALRALQPGGLLILETPNPENLVVGASSFYRDPSHDKPIPPELLAFATEHAGYARQLVVRLQEAPELRSAADVHLQQVLDGVSPDYAIVAQKAADPDVLARFDAAFGRDYGLSLETLARRYDTRAVERRAQLAGRIEHLQGLATQGQQQSEALRDGLAGLSGHVATALSRIEHLDQRGVDLAQRQLEQHAQLNTQLDALRALQAEQDARSAALDARIAAAEAHAAAMSQKVVDLLSSTSWQVTAPLRWAGGIALRLRTAQRNGTLGAAVRRRVVASVKPAVLALGRAVLRNPRAKRHARGVLARFPGLQARLREMLYRAPIAPTGAGAPPPQGQLPDDLSPRARRLYTALKQAQDQAHHKD